MKCLEKDRTRRYATADALAEDVSNYLNDRPVLAHPPSVWYRVGKFARKHTKGLVVGVVLAAALVAGATVSAWQAVQANRAKRELRSGLTRQVAERIQGDLGRFAAVGDALAAAAAARDDWTEEQLGEWMEEMLRREPRIYGLCLAYEPCEGIGQPAEYHLYKCRTAVRDAAIKTKQLTYAESYRDEYWYQLASRTGRSAWSEPFVDVGCGDIPMVTYVVPMFRGAGARKRFIGVLTVDLSLVYFDQLRVWLTDLNFGPHSYGFVVSQTGSALSHPDPEYDFGRRYEAKIMTARKLSDPAATDPELAALVRRMLAERTGEVRGTDPTTGRPATFLFAPVPLDRNAASPERWTFVAVIEE